MFSGTNLLTSCNSARCLFSAVFGFRKVSKEIFSELDRTNAKVNYFSWGTRSPEERWRGQPGGADPPQARGQVGPRLARVWWPWPPPGLAPSPIRSPRCRNPEYPDQKSVKPYIVATTIVPRSGGSKVLPGTLPEGRSSRRTSLRMMRE